MTDALAPVMVLAGGLSHERDVSLRSGRRVAAALRRAGHEVIESDLDSTVVERATTPVGDSGRTPVVFPVLHGEVGEDGALREVLELLDVPFVGTAGRACRVAFDKAIAGRVVARAGVRVPEQVALPHDIFRELGANRIVQALAGKVGFPMMVKPSRSGSALGATRVDSIAELPQALVAAYAYGPTAVVEHFVTGVEVAVTVIKNGDDERVLPAVQIEPESGTYDYAARYTAGATRFIVPAMLSDEVGERVEQMCRSVVQALQLEGIVRIDLLVDPDGEPWFIEANVGPGMTETSLVPLAMQAAGLDLGRVCSELVQAAAER